MKHVRLPLLLVVLCLAALADLVSVPTNLTRKMTTAGAVEVPATATTLYSADIWVTDLHLTNASASSLTCSIADRQSSPKTLFAALPIDAGAIYIAPLTSDGVTGRLFKGGITWSCSATGVHGWLVGRVAQ